MAQAQKTKAAVYRFGDFAQSALLTNLVKSLHMGTVPTVAASFSQFPISESLGLSIVQFQNQTFSDRTEQWQDENSEDSFHRLLMILNQTLIHNSTSHKLGEPTTSDQMNVFLSLNRKEESRRSRDRIGRALKKWKARSLKDSPMEVQALFHLTSLAFLMPDIQLLPSEALYPPRTLKWPDKTDRCSMPPTLEAVDSAWKVLESVASTKERLHIWLAPSVFLSALCVWRHINSKGDSRTHGSLQVLRVFRQELSTITWPCSQTMMVTLDKLTQQ